MNVAIMQTRMLVAMRIVIIIVETKIGGRIVTMVAAIRIVAMLWQDGQLQ